LQKNRDYHSKLGHRILNRLHKLQTHSKIKPQIPPQITIQMLEIET